MNKKGQVTIFVIMAILLIAIIVLFFLFKDKLLLKENSSQVSPVYTKTLSCLEITTEEGVEYLALHGGYYVIPEDISIWYLADQTIYYYVNSTRKIPSIEIVKEELEKYIHDRLKLCLDFKDMEEQGFEVKEGNLSVLINFHSNEINVKADYPLTITKGEEISRLSEFEVNIDSNLQKMYSASEKTLESYSLNPGSVCISCLEDISNEYYVQIKATPLLDVPSKGKNIIWFSVLDSESMLNWRFGVEQ